jgi:hypothetical protein
MLLEPLTNGNGRLAAHTRKTVAGFLIMLGLFLEATLPLHFWSHQIVSVPPSTFEGEVESDSDGGDPAQCFLCFLARSVWTQLDTVPEVVFTGDSSFEEIVSLNAISKPNLLADVRSPPGIPRTN